MASDPISDFITEVSEIFNKIDQIRADNIQLQNDVDDTVIQNDNNFTPQAVDTIGADAAQVISDTYSIGFAIAGVVGATAAAFGVPVTSEEAEVFGAIGIDSVVFSRIATGLRAAAASEATSTINVPADDTGTGSTDDTGTSTTPAATGTGGTTDDTGTATTPAATTGTGTDNTTEPGVPSAIPVVAPPASTPVSPIDTTGLTASDIDPRQIQYLINQGDTAQAAQLQAILDQGSSTSGNVTTYGGTGQFADPGTGNNTLAFSSGATDETLVPRGGGVDTVSGFSVDAGDKIDLGMLLSSTGVSLNDFSIIGNYLTSSTAGGSTALSFDPSGQGGGSVIAVLSGTSTSVSDLVAHNAITFN